MCSCKKNSRLEQLLKYLEGFFEYVGSPQSGSRVSYEEVYEDLLTSLYQLDDDGNKVIVDWNTDSNRFVIDVNRPVYVGSLRDNSNSNYVTTEGQHNGNYYNDIFNLGFKPANHEFPDSSVTLMSFIIDADEDSVLPISYNEDADECEFSNVVRALCLPKVNFYIYKKYDKNGIALPQFNGYFGIKRNGYEMIGYYSYPLEYEDTGVIDLYGHMIQRAKASVLMLPIHNDDSSKFKLLGHSDGNYGSEYDVDIEEYSFDSSVDYGQEVNAKGKYGLVHVNFVNADNNHADLVPTDSCQFIGFTDYRSKEDSSYTPTTLGYKWEAKCNDIYCTLEGVLQSRYNLRNYIDSSIRTYIINSLNYSAYNTRLISSKSMYLYNVEQNISIKLSDTVELGVKRLPLINLTGKLLKSDFDSSKPYIYIAKNKVNSKFGTLLCMYDDLDSDLILQAVDYSMNNNSNYRKISVDTPFIIYCSSTAPDKSYKWNKDDANAIAVYSLHCSKTEMNEEVQYELTKM